MSEPFVREFARASCNGVNISCSDGAPTVADGRDKFLDIAGGKLLGGRALPEGFLSQFSFTKENWNSAVWVAKSKKGDILYKPSHSPSPASRELPPGGSLG